MSNESQWAERIARDLLEDSLPRRWAHTKGVAVQARSLTAILGDYADLITFAAWLHDIGYAPAIAATSFHPLDGAATCATCTTPTWAYAVWLHTTPAQ